MKSIRFDGTIELEECLAGSRVLLLQQPNQRGYFISLVQQALADLGVMVDVDGFYGSLTAEAVKLFQQNTPGLGVDGKVGMHTMGALDDAFASEPESVAGCVGPEGPAISLNGVTHEDVNLLLSAVGLNALLEVSEAGTVTSHTPAQLLGVDAPATAGAARDTLAAPDHAFEGPGAPAVRLGDQLSSLLTTSVLADWPAALASVGTGSQWLAQQAAAALVGQPLSLAALPFGPPPPPVRALTPDMAYHEVAGHHLAGTVVMSPAPTLSPAGGVIVPAPIDRVTLQPLIAGVTFRFTPHPSARKVAVGSSTSVLASLDIRHAAGLVRLAQFLASDWNVDEVHHAGISGSAVRTDCHTDGRAIDLVGVRLTDAGVIRDVHVFDHWASKPVPAPGRPSGILPQWPTGSVPRLAYRLAAVDDLGILPADTRVTSFFFDLYVWFGTQYQDRTKTPFDPGPATTPGENSCVMSPDHPTSDPGGPHGREAHATHLHAQIGPT
jgi:peptidoglycan hydrolase-like protein with peptidoglycan-binding domain